MIISQLLGGLGNQMFQYALGKNLADLNNAPYKLDTSILLDWRPGKHAVNRDFDLNIFSLKPVFAESKEIIRYHSNGLPLIDKIKFKIHQKLSNDTITREKHFHFDPAILQLTGDKYLSGTWQSYKYFERIEASIRDDFRFLHGLSGDALELAKKITSVNSICLNVRRTDYVSVAVTAQAMAPISLDYYKLALKKMGEMVGEFEVFVFSDDLEWCKKNLQFIEQPLFFVDHRYAGKKFSDYLQLMTLCRHYIIPNSTFAWWGAWLNQDPLKTTIAPVAWFNDEKMDTKDLIPDNWIRL